MIGTRLAPDWQSIGEGSTELADNGLATDWRWIRDGLALDWYLIDEGFTLDWHSIGKGSAELADI